MGKAYDSQLMKRLLKYVKPYKKYVVVAILLNIIVAALGPVRPYLTKLAIADYIANGDYQGLLYISLAFFGSLLLQAGIQYFLTFYTPLMGQKIIFDLRVKVFANVQKLSLRFFDNTPIGRVVTRVTNDVESLNQLFSSGIVMVFSDIFIIFWILVFMFSMSWDLSLVTLSVLPILIYGTFLFRKKVRESYRDVRKYLAKLNSFTQEKLTGVSIIQMFTNEKEEIKTFASINNDHKKANIASIFYYAVFFPMVEILSSTAIG